VHVHSLKFKVLGIEVLNQTAVTINSFLSPSALVHLTSLLHGAESFLRS